MKMADFWMLTFFIYASPITGETSRAYMMIFALVMAVIGFAAEIYLSTRGKK